MVEPDSAEVNLNSKFAKKRKSTFCFVIATGQKYIYIFSTSLKPIWIKNIPDRKDDKCLASWGLLWNGDGLMLFRKKKTDKKSLKSSRMNSFIYFITRFINSMLISDMHLRVWCRWNKTCCLHSVLFLIAEFYSYLESKNKQKKQRSKKKKDLSFRAEKDVKIYGLCLPWPPVGQTNNNIWVKTRFFEPTCL